MTYHMFIIQTDGRCVKNPQEYDAKSIAFHNLDGIDAVKLQTVPFRLTGGYLICWFNGDSMVI